MTPGCAERWDWEFIRYIWEYRKRGRIRNLKMIREAGMMDRIVVLESLEQTEAFVRQVREKSGLDI